MENKKRPPLRKATASDVAKLAGVSKWTVSRAFTQGASISDRAKQNVLNAAKTLGWRPNLLARSLSNKRSHIIGIVVDKLQNPNLMSLLDIATRKLRQRGYMALLLNITSTSSYSAVMEMADQLQFDGLLFLGTVLTRELVALAQDIHKIPLVKLCRSNDDPYIQVITTDGYDAGCQVADLFYQQGFRRFGYMKGPDTDSSQLLRLDGYRDRLQALGLCLCQIIHANGYQRQRGVDAMQHYLKQNPGYPLIDALFCENDILAIGALEALRQTAGNYPIAIVGFDDIEIAASEYWSLTTIKQPLEQMVDTAIMRLVVPDKNPQHLIFPGELIVIRSHLQSSIR